VYSMILMRHGQSTANADGEFTGWVDVALTELGERQAKAAAELIRADGLLPDVVHTSVFQRSIRSAEIILGVLDRQWLPAHRSWRLNERQYGALTGRRKTEVRAEVGEEVFRTWRRSLHGAPPPLAASALADLRALPCYADLPADTVPPVESLADVLARAVPYWIDVLAVELRAGRTPLVVAHGNALRALTAHWDRCSEQEIVDLNIPTGIPLRYDFDADLRPLRRGGRYLDPVAAAHASAAVAREGTAADVDGVVSRAAGRP
jgi:2,3-bisphosphoglycerate-dependent phosphoglycerate mutase